MFLSSELYRTQTRIKKQHSSRAAERLSPVQHLRQVVVYQINWLLGDKQHVQTPESCVHTIPESAGARNNN